MELEYRDHPEHFTFFEMEEYLELMVDIVERLNPAIAVERIAGEIRLNMGVRPGWGTRYNQVIKNFEELLERRQTHQGRLYTT